MPGRFTDTELYEVNIDNNNILTINNIIPLRLLRNIREEENENTIIVNIG